jgi:hypothetical protein
MAQSEKVLEILTTVLLAVAAVATAWSTYQASLWNGIQATNYTEASAARTRAGQKHLEANQGRLADLSLVENLLNAESRGDTSLADFYRVRFREPLKTAFAAWSALDPRTNVNAPSSPLDMPEYRPAMEQDSAALSATADETFQRGEDANASSDSYVATTIFFASALFFAAVSERFDYRPARIGLLTVAAVVLFSGIIFLATRPVTFG